MNILALLQPIQNNVSKTTLRQMSRIIRHVGDDRAGHDVGFVTLGRRRRQLPHDPTLLLHGHSLGASVLAVLLADTCFRKMTFICWQVMNVWSAKRGRRPMGWITFSPVCSRRSSPSLSFFVISLVSVKQRHSYPLCMEQTVRSAEEKAACKAKKEAQKAKAAGPKGKPGRPKGSKNKDKTEVELNPELKRIQKMLAALLVRISSGLRPTYLALDGHFGNYPAYHMVRQTGLHLISKLRWDAALCFPYEGPYQGSGPSSQIR